MSRANLRHTARRDKLRSIRWHLSGSSEIERSWRCAVCFSISTCSERLRQAGCRRDRTGYSHQAPVAYRCLRSTCGNSENMPAELMMAQIEHHHAAELRSFRRHIFASGPSYRQDRKCAHHSSEHSEVGWNSRRLAECGKQKKIRASSDSI